MIHGLFPLHATYRDARHFRVYMLGQHKAYFYCISDIHIEQRTCLLKQIAIFTADVLSGCYLMPAPYAGTLLHCNSNLLQEKHAEQGASQSVSAGPL